MLLCDELRPAGEWIPKNESRFRKHSCFGVDCHLTCSFFRPCTRHTTLWTSMLLIFWWVHTNSYPETCASVCRQTWVERWVAWTPSCYLTSGDFERTLVKFLKFWLSFVGSNVVPACLHESKIVPPFALYPTWACCLRAVTYSFSCTRIPSAVAF